MSKAAVYTMLSSDAALISMGFTADAWFSSASAESPLQRPFGIIKWGGSFPAFKLTGSTDVTIWLYDEPGSYVRINAAIERIKRLITSAVQVQGSDQMTLTMAQWSGDSEDLYDDIYKCVTRNSTFTVLMRQS